MYGNGNSSEFPVKSIISASAFKSVFFFYLLNDIAADVLLWRNKKISASVLAAATAIWVLFEWLNYNFLSLLFLALVLVLSVQFLWTNASTMFSRLSKHP
jgi:hypothetical protein